MQIYGLKSCDTCRAARKALPQASFVDVRDSGVPDNLLSRALDELGTALVNKKSTTWRGLDEAARDTPPLTLLKAHPTLMKRPLIVWNDRLYLGWTKETQAALGV